MKVRPSRVSTLKDMDSNTTTLGVNISGSQFRRTQILGSEYLAHVSWRRSIFPLLLENRADLRHLQWVEKVGKGDWLGWVSLSVPELVLFGLSLGSKGGALEISYRLPREGGEGKRPWGIGKLLAVRPQNGVRIYYTSFLPEDPRHSRG